MDIASLLSTSVPSYFVLGPLVILLIGLVVMAARKASPITPVATVMQTPTPTPTPTPLPVTASTLSQVSAQSVVPTAPISEPVQQSVSAPIVTPTLTPEPVVPETPVSVTHVVAPQPTSTALEAVTPVVQVTEPVATPSVAQVVTSQESAPVAQPEAVVQASTIPPVSAWKTSEPVAVPTDMTHTEAEMQAAAVVVDDAQPIRA